MKVQFAKTHLSALLKSVERGEEVVISRGDRPVARLIPFDASGDRELGFVNYRVPDDFDEPLPDDVLAEWDT